MAIQWSKKRWAYLLEPLLLITIGVVIAGVNGDDDETTTRPEVTIPQGTLMGVNMETYYGRSIYGFKGIPYAKPPVGDLRFAAPVAPDAWEGTLDASSDSTVCAQSTNNAIRGGEDCLYLNVYTPSLPTSGNSTLLPVMLFIYGGAFRMGSNSAKDYNPDFLLDKDVILVVPAYRLGVLGFLSTGDEAASGNWGLKDVVRALEWNQENIRYFGGDPNRVTVFGESAGGISTHLMAFSSLTEGLFHRYIFESGAALSYDSQRPKEVMAERSTVLAEYLGCPTTTSSELVNCLRTMSLTQLIVEPASLFEVYDGNPSVVWSPSIEPDIEGAFLTERPANLITAGKYHDLPFIASANRDEGIIKTIGFMTDPDSFETFLENIDVALPPSLTYDTLVTDVTAYTEGLKSFYLNDLTADRTELVTNYTQLLGDALVVFPSYSSNQELLASSKSSHYLCSFEYRGTFSNTYSRTKSTENYGVAHMDELIYLFQPTYSQLGPADAVMNEADLQVVETMVQLWTSFATTGTPTITLASSNGVVWEPYSSSKNYLRIGSDADPSIAVQYKLADERMLFWEKLHADTTWL